MVISQHCPFLGSSNTWVGADKKYKKTESTLGTGATVVGNIISHCDAAAFILTVRARGLRMALAPSPVTNVGVIRSKPESGSD